MSKSPKANMSFQQSVVMAARAQTREDIKAEVAQAASVLTNELKKSLIALKQRADVFEDIIKAKLNLSDKEIQETLWSVQEKAYGLELISEPAAKNNAIRFRVKEEKEGEETDTPPTQESFLVLGQDDDELPKELVEALTGTVAGDTRKVSLYSDALKSNYTVTMEIDRVYKDKTKGA